jgi:Inner membrane component of T3SS, cytoplasmic domain
MMSSEKIRISWDDVQDPQIDLRLKQQQTLERAQQHYEQRVDPQFQHIQAPSPPSRRSLWSSGLLAVILFGLAGGIVAWGLTEIAGLAEDSIQDGYELFVTDIQHIRNQMLRGEITRSEATGRILALSEKLKDNPYVQILMDSSLDDAQRDARLDARREIDRRADKMRQMLFFSIIAVAIAVSISIAEPVLGRNPRGIVCNGLLALLLGAGGGVLVSLFINTLYQSLGGGERDNLPRQIFARAMGWAVLGLFLAVAPGIILRSWKRSAIGLVGGFCGGLLGGLLFDPIGLGTGSAVASRFCAIATIGVVTAAGTALIEQVAKTGWLRVATGLIAGKQFILYRDPTQIGSSPQCEIYLFKDPQIAPRHALIHRVSGGFDIEDCQTTSSTFVNGQVIQRSRLRSGDQIQIGSSCLSFQEKSGTS